MPLFLEEADLLRFSSLCDLDSASAAGAEEAMLFFTERFSDLDGGFLPSSSSEE